MQRSYDEVTTLNCYAFGNSQLKICASITSNTEVPTVDCH